MRLSNHMHGLQRTRNTPPKALKHHTKAPFLSCERAWQPQAFLSFSDACSAPSSAPCIPRTRCRLGDGHMSCWACLRISFAEHSAALSPPGLAVSFRSPLGKSGRVTVSVPAYVHVTNSGGSGPGTVPGRTHAPADPDSKAVHALHRQHQRSHSTVTAPAPRPRPGSTSAPSTAGGPGRWGSRPPHIANRRTPLVHSALGGGRVAFPFPLGP